METGKQRTSMGANAGKGQEVPVLVIVPVEALEPAIDRAAVLEPAIVQAGALEPAIAPAVVEERVIVPAAVLELAIAPAVVQELEIVLVEELELAIAPAVGELELVRVAVAQRTRLGTAAHRPGLVPVPKKGEDLAVAAETTREPAATEAATAWAAEE